MTAPIELPASLLARFADMLPDNGLGKYERMTWWRECADGWKIAYTTTRVVGGKYDGRFITVAYRPTGPGARTGNASTWELVYHRGFAKRKDARARSIVLWNEHEAKGGGRPRPNAR